MMIIINNYFLILPDQSKPAYAASANEVGKERKKPTPEETTSPPQSSEGSTAENGVEGREAEQLNGNKDDGRAPKQPESALSYDSKMCNTNPHLNALNADSDCHRDETLGASVLKKEE